MRHLPLLVASVLLALPAAAQEPQEPTGTFDEELGRYEASLGRKALYLRALAAERFSRTRDARALQALLRRYARPEAPEDHVRYLLAGLAGDAFAGAEHAAAWAEVTRSAKDAPDAWLWLFALAAQAEAGVEGVVRVATDAKADPFVRAAALEVLADEARADAALNAVAAVLAQQEKLKGVERAALVEACAWALPAARARLGTDAFGRAAGLVLDALDGKRTGLRTKLVVARALARTFGTSTLFLDAGSWRKVLAAGAAAAQAPTPEGGTRTRVQGAGGVTTPRFFGIEGAGLRVAFVLDLSDSMLEPLKQAELDDLRRPRTGDVPGPEDPDRDLPWDRLRTRFDLAREVLKRSLRALGEGMSFGVVVFGTTAKPLTGPSLLRATRQNVARAVAALDALAPGKPAQDRPNGTLEGYTNLHGGLRAAFRLTEAAPIAAHEHVAPQGFDTGCDTLFLLSDGAPSWDDFDAEDVAAEGMTAGDPETGRDDGASEELHYYGPYVEWRFLVRDVRRMNLFRRVEVHCVGIGEADPQLLRELAALGRGELRTIGAAR